MADQMKFDWSTVTLVVFDVDGTLYRQSGMRQAMLRELVLHTIWTRDTRALRVLRSYRKIREDLGDQDTEGFDAIARDQTAVACSLSRTDVDQIVSEWMDQRPLPHLLKLRYPGLTSLFEDIRSSGRTLGVLSDFPAADKLSALGLSADIIVSAVDPEVGLSKPHPRGLETVIAKAGATPASTVLIGDRWSRDGLAAERAGSRCLIRADKPLPGKPWIAGFEDAIFAPLRQRIAA